MTESELPHLPKQPIRDSERNTIKNLLTITYKPIIDCKLIYRNDMLNEYYNLVPLNISKKSTFNIYGNEKCRSSNTA